MTTTIQIPVDGDEQDRQIVDTYGIAVVKGWELAARIYARCEPQQARKPAHAVLSAKLADKISFAALSRNTGRSETNIRKHWHHWDDAIEQGWTVPVKPGDRVVLPEEEYPPTRNGGGLDDGVTAAAPAEKKVEVVHELMRRDPEVAARLENAFVQKAAQDPRLAGRVAAAYEEHHVAPQPKQPIDFGADRYTGLSAEIWGDVNAYRGRIKEYAAQLQRRAGDAELSAIVHEEIDRLERTKQLLDGYADELRAAIGISHDDVFARLMRS